MGYIGNIEETVLYLALLAKQCGLDGVVCSPQEIKLIRAPLTVWPPLITGLGCLVFFFYANYFLNNISGVIVN